MEVTGKGQLTGIDLDRLPHFALFTTLEEERALV
jgi:hypothetical protein